MRSYRNYEDTHQALIEKAVELVSCLGADALSVSALARALQLNRSTIYFHFESREALKTAAFQCLSEGSYCDHAKKVGIGHFPSAECCEPEIITKWIGHLH